MPEMDGMEATRRIRQECPQCHVLILTVHAQERYLFPVLKAGAAGYVLKSTVDTELLDAIRSSPRAKHSSTPRRRVCCWKTIWATCRGHDRGCLWHPQ